MTTPERKEISAKHIDYHDLLVTNILHLGLLRGFSPHKLNVDVKTERQEKNGAKTIRVEPFLLGSIKQADLKAGSGNKFLLHDPFNIMEKNCYVVTMAERNWGDGEKTDNVVISKIPSPHTYKNKREWVIETVNSTLNPFTSQAEFHKENIHSPTILITFYDRSVSVSHAGELDRFLSEVYAFYPEKEQ